MVLSDKFWYDIILHDIFYCLQFVVTILYLFWHMVTSFLQKLQGGTKEEYEYNVKCSNFYINKDNLYKLQKQSIYNNKTLKCSA